MDKITITPWKITPISYPKSALVRIMSGNKVIAYINNDHSVPAPESDNNAAAIVSAVNATYGNGIDPEAVNLMIAAIKRAIELKDLWCPLQNSYISEAHEDEMSALSHMKLSFIEALEKAKL